MMQKVEEERPVIEFRCSACGMEETCEYRGTTPKFVRNVRFTEEVYVMRDPFSPPPSGSESRKSLSEYYLVLGADCSGCRKTVCKAPECSFFYSRTFCLPCAMDSIREFPLEIQSKIRKQVAK